MSNRSRVTMTIVNTLLFVLICRTARDNGVGFVGSILLGGLSIVICAFLWRFIDDLHRHFKLCREEPEVWKYHIPKEQVKKAEQADGVRFHMDQETMTMWMITRKNGVEEAVEIARAPEERREDGGRRW